MDTIKAFFADYGYSFLMMVVIGFVISIITEITIKKALNWLEEKVKGHERLVAIVNVLRTVSLQCVTWCMVIVFTKLLVETMPLPGNGILWPVWICLVYIIQFVFSMYGIKGLLAAIKRHSEKKKEPKEKEPEKDPLEGLEKISDNLYRDKEGHYFQLKGKKVVRT